jgi:hypothetical protein
VIFRGLKCEIRKWLVGRGDITFHCLLSSLAQCFVGSGCWIRDIFRLLDPIRAEQSACFVQIAKGLRALNGAENLIITLGR